MSTFRSDLRESDIAAVRALVTTTGVFSGIEVGWAGEIIEAALRNPASAGYFALDGRWPERVLKAMPATARSKGQTTGFDLYWIAVSPTAQGKGLGRRLLAACVEDARARGATHMFIDTSTRTDYAAARSLYKAQGFELQGMLVDFYSDGDSKAIFGRRL
jgi:ribosomal protein S18 acetylase RimI-like enzyme